MSLKGVLSDFPVSDVFQLIAQQRKTGVLQVEQGERTLEVFFLEGDVVRARPAESRPDVALAGFLLRTGVVSESALAQARREQDETLEPLAKLLLARDEATPAAIEEVARLTTQEAIFELFLWDEGRFEFRAEPVEYGDFDQRLDAERFLLDALRMRDEWAEVVTVLADLSAIVTKGADFDAFRSQRDQLARSCGAKPEELGKLFDLVNDRLSARRVIDLSRLGTFTGARGLVEMLRAGVIRLETPSTKRAPVARRARGGRVLGAATLLAGSAVAIALHLVPPQRHPDFPVPQVTVQEAQAQVATDRLRAALEVHRWKRGEYPRSLGDLSDASGELLAGLRLDRYSYTLKGRGYTLRRRHP